MKKKLSIILLSIITMVSISGCGNKDILDMNYTFNKAIISLQNGEVIEVDVKSWKDYEGEQLQIESTDGTFYLTSSYNCTLIKE